MGSFHFQKLDSYSVAKQAAAIDIGVALGLVLADAELDELVIRLGAMLGALMR